MHRASLTFLAAAFIALAGCTPMANRNVEEHKSALRGTSAQRYEGRATILAPSGSAQEDVVRMFEQGYGLIEHVTYTGSDDPTATAIAYARSIGASHVILNSRHNATRREIDASLAAASPLVAAFFPKTVVYRDNTAFYFAPLERKGVGLLVVDLTEETRNWLVMSNMRNGVAVAAVRPGSPGRAADIRPGDIVVRVNDREVLDREGFGVALGQVAGDHTFQLVRNGDTLEKRASVPAMW